MAARNMEFEVPVVNTEVDTEDPGASGLNILGAVVGTGILMGVVAAASYGFNRVQDAVGVSDDDVDVPGI